MKISNKERMRRYYQTENGKKAILKANSVWQQKNKERVAEYQRKYRERNIEVFLIRGNKKRKIYESKPQNKIKISARKAVRYAIKIGKLRVEPCEVCGVLPTHAHHDDYRNKLSVRWLCPRHHGEVDKRLRVMKI